MTVTNHYQPDSLFVLSQDALIEIFGRLDEKTLGRILSVCSSFNNLLKTQIVPLGTNDRTRCILNFLKKTIIPISVDSLNFGICWTAMNHPNVPNGSYAAYPRNNNVALVIKDRNGQVKHIFDAIYKMFPDAVAMEIKQQIGLPTEYNYFAQSIGSRSPEQNTNYAEGIRYLTQK